MLLNLFKYQCTLRICSKNIASNDNQAYHEIRYVIQKLEMDMIKLVNVYSVSEKYTKVLGNLMLKEINQA